MKQNKITSLVIISLMLMSLFASFGVAQTSAFGSIIYPSFFKDKTVFIVVGDTAHVSDVEAATDISVALNNQGIKTIAKLASEISDITQVNAIVMGNPCNNAITAKLFGNPVQCSTFINEGKGIIQMFSYPSGTVAIVVAGIDPTSARNVAKMVAGWKDTTIYANKLIIFDPQPISTTPPPRFAAISGNKASYTPSETIFWPVKAVEPDGTPASFEEGYYIQFYTHNTATGQRVDSIVNKGQYNAEYNSNDGYWYVKFEAPETADKYYTTLALYCSRENTKCSNTYGMSPSSQWEKNVDFYVSGTSGGTQCTDSDRSPDYLTQWSGIITPDKSPDLFVRGVGKGEYTGSTVQVIYGTEPNPTFAKPTAERYTTYYDHCATRTQLNEAFCTSDGKLGAHGIHCPIGCSNGACIQTVSQQPSTAPKLYVRASDGFPTESVIPPGSKSYVLLALKFTAPENTAVAIDDVWIVDLVNGAPGVSSDLQNFVLLSEDGYQVGQTVPEITPAPVGTTPAAVFKGLKFIVPKGQTKVLYLHADTSPTASSRKHAFRLDAFVSPTYPVYTPIQTNWLELQANERTGRTFVIGTQFVAPPTSTMQIYTDKLEYAENEPVSIRTIMPTLMNCENYFVAEYGQEFKRSYGGCPIDGQSYSGPAPGLGVWKAKVVAWYPEQYIVLHPSTPAEKFTLYSKQFTVGQTRPPITIGQSRIERLNNLEVIGKFYLDSGFSFVSNGVEYSFDALTISQPDRVAKLTINGEIIKLKEGEKQRIANGAIFYLEEVLPQNIDFRLVTPSTVVPMPTVDMRCEARGSLSLSREMEECIGNSISETERRLIDDNCEDILSGNPAFSGCNRGQKDFEIVECAKQKFPQTAERINKCISGQQERRCESRQSIQIEGTELGNCLERVFDGADKSQIRRCDNDVFKRMPAFSACDDNQIAPLVINCARELMPQLSNGINNCFRQAQVPLIVPPAPAMPGVQPSIPPVIVQPPIQQRRDCNGCEVNNRCLSFGIRLVGENGVPSYCDWDKSFKAQKTESQSCQNNYECVSNSCSNGQCKTVEDRRGIEAERLEAIERQLKEQQNVLERILNFFKRLFGG